MESRIQERRRKERFIVNWPGTLICLFPNYEEEVRVKVSEISATGARLELENLKVGPYHIVVGSDSSRFTLKLNLPDGTVSTPIRIVWYSMDEGKRHFNIGVLFPQLTGTGLNAIEKVLNERE